MTVEIFVPPGPYDIEAAGPYDIPFPYAPGAVKAYALLGGVLTPLVEGEDFTIDPLSTLTGQGDLTLSPDAFATWGGGQLFIDRETDAEQGWLGQMAREKGLEAQLDMTVMSVQELQIANERSLRSTLPVPPFAPGGDGTVLMWQAGGILPGPTAAQIALAQGHAETAVAAAQAAAQSAAEALAKQNSMLRDRGAWVTGLLYSPSDLFTYDGRSYITQIAHLASSVGADQAAGRIRVFADRGAAGTGTGDMLKSENLSGLTDVPMAQANLGLPQLLCQTGMVAAFSGATAPQGWIACAGQTIGSAASGASYANAAAQALFAHMWGQFDNTLLPILDSAGDASTRGANAAADWAANKRLPILDLRGEFIRGLDGGRGADAGRVLGSAQADENKSHSHAVTDPGHAHGVTTGTATADNPSTTRIERRATTPNSGSAISSTAAFTGITIASSGGDEARPRNIALLYCVKL